MTIGETGNQHIEKWERLVGFNFHGEFDVFVLVIEVVKKGWESVFTMWPNYESVIDITEPDLGFET